MWAPYRESLRGLVIPFFFFFAGTKHCSSCRHDGRDECDECDECDEWVMGNNYNGIRTIIRRAVRCSGARLGLRATNLSNQIRVL
jgi:hypothetical protein